MNFRKLKENSKLGLAGIILYYALVVGGIGEVIKYEVRHYKITNLEQEIALIKDDQKKIEKNAQIAQIREEYSFPGWQDINYVGGSFVGAGLLVLGGWALLRSWSKDGDNTTGSQYAGDGTRGDYRGNSSFRG